MSAADADATGAEEPSYRFVHDVARDGAVGYHVNNLEIAEILFDARNRYITGVGIDWSELLASGRNLVMRQLCIDYEAEAEVDAALQVGVRVAGRSRRSLTLDEVLWADDRRLVIARGRSVHVSVSVAAAGAVEIPEDVWGCFERFESAGS